MELTTKTFGPSRVHHPCLLERITHHGSRQLTARPPRRRPHPERPGLPGRRPRPGPDDFLLHPPCLPREQRATTTLGFEGLAPDGGNTNYPLPAGLTLSGVNFSVSPAFTNSLLFVIGKNSYYPGNSVLSTQNTQAQQGDLLITFSSPVTAIGLDFGDNFNPNTATFTLSNGATFTRPTGSGTNFNFVGLTTTVPITTLDIQEPNNFALNIDNFTFGRSAPVPEASTTVSLGLLLALGLGGLVIAKRRRKAARPTA